MTSHGTISVVVSPKGDGNGQPMVNTASTNSPKMGQCLCSPTTHNGSFRCRFHRSLSSTWRMKRSNSMPANSAATTSISPKSVEST